MVPKLPATQDRYLSKEGGIFVAILCADRACALGGLYGLSVGDIKPCDGDERNCDAVKVADGLPLSQDGLLGKLVVSRHCGLSNDIGYNAPMQLVTANITGDGDAHTLASVAGLTVNQCKWFQLLNSGGGTLNVGGPETDATHGYPVPATGANFQPPMAQSMEFYDLAAITYWLTNAETAVILCAF